MVWMSIDILEKVREKLQMNAGKILITGATGDTGGHAIEQLLQKSHEVRALVPSIDDRSRGLEDKGVEVGAADYLDPGAMRTAGERSEEGRGGEEGRSRGAP